MDWPDLTVDSIHEGEPRRAAPTDQSHENAIRQGAPQLSVQRVRFLSRRCLALGAMAVAFVSVVVACYVAQRSQFTGPELHYYYLLVDVVGPPEWEKNHTFSVQWQGKDLPLPVVFRVTGNGGTFQMGGDIIGSINIGKYSAPVSVEPATHFQVRNTGIIAFFAWKSSRGTVEISSTSSVAISPPEYPAVLDFGAKPEERESAGQKLEKRIEQLIAKGNIIDVQLTK